MGFEVIATRGTAQAISRMGVPVKGINKIGEGSPHVVDYIRSGAVDMVINTPTGSGARSDGYEIRNAAVRHGLPCITTMTGASAAVRAIVAQQSNGHEPRSLQELYEADAALGAAAETGSPAGRRRDRPGPRAARAARVPRSAARRETGGYVVFSALDADGPEPLAGQFYMLAGEPWEGEGGRPYLARAFSVAAAERRADGVRLDFLVEAVGPGHGPAGRARARRRPAVTGPLGDAVLVACRAGAGAAGAILVGGGIGIAPLAILRRAWSRAGTPTRTLLGFRDEAHSGGLELFDCSEIRLASEDGHAGHKGYVTDLLAVMLEGDDAGSAAVYACGPPAMLEAVRAICAERDVPAELAMEAPMACGFGACFGCAVPLADGGYMRLCVDGPVVRADELASALVAGSGH